MTPSENWGGARIGAGRPRKAQEDSSSSGDSSEHYSITRGLQSLLKRGYLEGVEAETHEEVLREIDSWGATSTMRSALLNTGLPHMLVPWSRVSTAIPYPPPPWPVAPSSSAGNLNQTQMEVSQHLLGSAACVQVGARLLPNLSGNVALARINSHIPTAWLGENDSVLATDPTVEQLGLYPRRISAMVVYTSQLLVQAPDIDTLILADFRQALSQQIDYAVLLGRGPLFSEPRGLWNNPDVVRPPLVASDTLEWEWFTSATERADRLVAGGLSFGAITSPSGKRQWATLSKFPVAQGGGLTIWDSIPNKSVTPVFGLDDAIVAGPWEMMTIGTFGPAVDVLVDKFSQSGQATVRLICNAWVDVACRLPQAFTMSIRSPAPPPVSRGKRGNGPESGIEKTTEGEPERPNSGTGPFR
jgi:Phage capsid family